MRDFNRREWLGLLGFATVGFSPLRAGKRLISNGFRTTALPHLEMESNVSDPLNSVQFESDRPYSLPLNLKRADRHSKVYELAGSFSSPDPRYIPWQSAEDQLMILQALGPLLGEWTDGYALPECLTVGQFPKTFDYEASKDNVVKTTSEDQTLFCSIVFPERFSIRYENSRHELSATIDPNPIVIIDTKGAIGSQSIPRNQRLRYALISQNIVSYMLTCSLFPEWRTLITTSRSSDFRERNYA